MLALSLDVLAFQLSHRGELATLVGPGHSHFARRPSMAQEVNELRKRGPTSPSSNGNALLALNLVTLIWGSQHAIIKDLVDSCPPAAINAVRFSSAALLASPWLPGAKWSDTSISIQKELPSNDYLQKNETRTYLEIVDDQAIWQSGVQLGGWMFAGYALQAFGLQFTTASRSAFLLYLNVKLVPLFALMLYGRQSEVRTWLSACIAFAGTALLSADGAPPNIGDVFSLSAAAASALFILQLESASRVHAPAALNAVTLVCTAGYCLVWAFFDLTFVEPEVASGLLETMMDLAPSLLYLSVVTTALANWLQTIGQADVRAQDAAIIYSLDPVYGAAFSWLLLGETMGMQGFIGVGLVLLAVGISRRDSSEI